MAPLRPCEHGRWSLDGTSQSVICTRVTIEFVNDFGDHHPEILVRRLESPHHWNLMSLLSILPM